MQINLIHNYKKIFSPSLTKENVQFWQCACKMFNLPPILIALHQLKSN